MREGMKTYRVTLIKGLQIAVKADRWVKDGNTIGFLSGQTEIARYYTASMERIEDCTMAVLPKLVYLRPSVSL